jgi:hypothetical protein
MEAKQLIYIMQVDDVLYVKLMCLLAGLLAL